MYVLTSYEPPPPPTHHPVVVTNLFQSTGCDDCDYSGYQVVRFERRGDGCVGAAGRTWREDVNMSMQYHQFLAA